MRKKKGTETEEEDVLSDRHRERGKALHFVCNGKSGQFTFQFQSEF